MHYVVATGIRIVGKIEMRDFEINAKSFSEKAHTIVRGLKSLNRTERDVRDDAIRRRAARHLSTVNSIGLQ